MFALHACLLRLIVLFNLFYICVVDGWLLGLVDCADLISLRITILGLLTVFGLWLRFRVCCGICCGFAGCCVLGVAGLGRCVTCCVG